MPDWMTTALINATAGMALEAIGLLWRLLSASAFATPDVTVLPQVTAVTGTSVAIVNVSFVLAVLTAGIVVMARETVQNRYGLSELAPRLVIGWLGANFAVPICQQLVGLANALTRAFAADDLTADGSFAQLRRVIVDALTDPASALLALVIGLILAALTGMLIVTWIVRLGVLIVLVGISPVALACHATPWTEPAARLWWRSMLATLATVVMQAIALHTTLSVFLDPDANLADLGVPDDPTGIFNLFVVVCLLWVVVKIPGLMRRYVTRGGGGTNVAGLIVRMVVMQQLTNTLRLPARAGRARAAAARGGPHTGGAAVAGGRRPRPDGGGGGGRVLPPPRGAGPGRVGVAWPTGRPVRPYTAQELAAGVDPYTRTLPKRSVPAATVPPRATRPPVQATGAVATPPRSGLPPVMPAGVTPATAIPQSRPVRPPVSRPWQLATRRR